MARGPDSTLRGLTALIILMATTPSIALPVPLDVTSASNGITDLVSATFDGPLFPCSASSPSYCSFFGGEPGSPARNVVITPNPTRVINAVPIGITPVPVSGSFLDLTLNGARTQLTIAGGTIAVPAISLTILRVAPSPTFVDIYGAGIVFDAAPRTAAIDANGRAEFLVNLAPATAVDFSRFTDVAFPPAGSCAGPLCSLIPILNLDMVRYRLVIDYDATFSSFTGQFIGQTAGNSLLTISMDSAPLGARCEDFAAQVNQNSTNNALPVASRCTGFESPFTVSVTTPPAHGTANVSGTDIVYTPNLNYFGPDTLTYQGSDGLSTDTGVLTITVTSTLDTDGDGVVDGNDNCTQVANAQAGNVPGTSIPLYQLDSDHDGYGNLCDADLNNSGLVTTADFAMLRSVLNELASYNALSAAADMNGSGTVTATDFAILRARLNTRPGPSGLHPNCPPTCP